MKPSPLEFARDFEKLKSDLSRLPAADLKLLQLVGFWERLAPVAGKSAYESYLNDYCSLVINLVQADALSDLTIDSLNQVRRVLNDLVDVSGIDAASTSLLIAALGASLRVATLLFYVGAHDEALSLCAQLEGVDDLALPADSELRGLSPLDTLRTIYDKYRRDYPELGTMLQGILAQWEEDALAVEHDRVWCLFVDKDGEGNAATGRMRLLRGTVEQVAGGKKSSLLPDLIGPRGRQTPSSAPPERKVGAGLPPSGDMVAFDNQIKTPDDPFIGVAYDSLKAVRTGLRSAGFAQRAEGSYRAFLSIDGSNRTFTGDSIGLAVSLVAFTQLLKPEVMRQERFIASDIAVTGGITADGRITPVNNDSIAAKIERAFFSHVRYVVLPEANLASARDTVKHLNKQYPRRRLRLVSAAHLDDVLNDRNIIRSEKVCLGAFITKKAARYTRATKVQVPLLIALIWLLLAIFWPKHFDPWFDWHIDRIEVHGNRFRTINADGHTIWWSAAFEYDLNSKLYVPLEKGMGRFYYASDVNGDEKDELYIVPRALSGMVKPTELQLHGDDTCYWSRKTHILTEYDSLYALAGSETEYSTFEIIPMPTRDGDTYIITVSQVSSPARLQIMCFSSTGGVVSGPYLNTGHKEYLPRPFLLDINHDENPELFMLGTNNRLNRACLAVLNVEDLSGFSPMTDNALARIETLQYGSHLYYLTFPETDLSAGVGVRNWAHSVARDSESHNYTIRVKEGCEARPSGVALGMDAPVVSYVFDSCFTPVKVSFPVNEYNRMCLYQQQLGLPPCLPEADLVRLLINGVTVFRGDSALYNPVVGVYFYAR